jgi:hypothetical protein
MAGNKSMVWNIRTKLGVVVGVAVLVGLISFKLALLLLAAAAFLIAWGQEPQRTENFIGGLPGGGHLLKALAQLDAALCSRGP